MPNPSELDNVASALTRAPDLLRRFTPTPFQADLNMTGRVIHLETNSLALLEQWKALLGESHGETRGRAAFLWRIVAENDLDGENTWPEMTVFSQSGLSFASIGHRGFLAVDSKEREAVGFAPEGLVNNASGFSWPFLATLSTLTARAVGLTPVPAACVAQGDVGLLVFGPPKSGKTISSYLAGHFGLDLHSDRLVFFEATTSGLLAWGEFWPACFYQDAQYILPELVGAVRPFDYGGRTYLYLEKPLRAGARLCVTPTACVFLERQNTHGHALTRVRDDEFHWRLNEYGQFPDVPRSELGRSEAWNLLCRLPAFHLAYGHDSRVPARIFCDLINDRET